MQKIIFYFRFIISCILVHCSITTFGQIKSIYPENFSGYFNAPFFVNPSYVPLMGDVNIGFNYRSRRIISDLATMGFHIEKIARFKNKSSHLFRIAITNEKSGQYLSSPKLYFNYGGGLMLGNETYLYAGLLLGIISENYNPPSGSASGNVPDGAIGIGLRKNSFLFGLSSFQVFSSSVQLLSQFITFNRYYVANMDGALPLSSHTDLKIYSLLRHFDDLPNQYIVGSGISYDNFIEGGVIYQHNQGMVVYGSLEFNHENNPFYLYFSYNSGLTSQGGSINDSYEMSLRYTINKKNKVLEE